MSANLAAQDSAGSAAKRTLEGSNWQLSRLTVLGGHVFIPDDPDKYVLNFRSENRLTGRSDCNQISGIWHLDGQLLHFKPFLTSRNLCSPGSLHNNLVLYLGDVVRQQVIGNLLILNTTTEGVSLEFKAR